MKTKLSKRIKRALAGFLKEELLEMTALNDGITVLHHDHMKVYEMKCTIDLEVVNTDSENMYYNRIDQIKTQFVNSMLKHVRCDFQDFANFECREIRLSLPIGIKTEIDNE